jgi:GNAT superfamily N-acetyltransferase
MRLTLQPATEDDAATLATLHCAVAEELTRIHGPGPWSSRTSERGVLLAMRTSNVYVARAGGMIVGTFRLAKKKPWAIDVSYFTPCRTPFYLLGMAVVPDRQRRGIGAWCLERARELARKWPADAIRLDAYDANAGAGPFYAKCGYTEVGRTTYRGAPLIYYELVLGNSRKR